MGEILKKIGQHGQTGNLHGRTKQIQMMRMTFLEQICAKWAEWLMLPEVCHEDFL